MKLIKIDNQIIVEVIVTNEMIEDYVEVPEDKVIIIGAEVTDYDADWNYIKAIPEETIVVDKWQRLGDLKNRLEEIDTLSVRPLRAKLAGMATSFDEEKLVALETEADEIRTEIQEILGD